MRGKLVHWPGQMSWLGNYKCLLIFICWTVQPTMTLYGGKKIECICRFQHTKHFDCIGDHWNLHRLVLLCSAS